MTFVRRPELESESGGVAVSADSPETADLGGVRMGPSSLASAGDVAERDAPKSGADPGLRSTQMTASLDSRVRGPCRIVQDPRRIHTS